MEDQNELLAEAAIRLAGPFGIEGADELSADAEGLHNQVKSVLSARIAQLLESDFEQLMQICYKLDLAEEKVRRALFGVEDIKPSDALAELIIKRQIQRIQIWNKYSGK